MDWTQNDGWQGTARPLFMPDDVVCYVWASKETGVAGLFFFKRFRWEKRVTYDKIMVKISQ